jgi:hypothetical protein
MHFGNTIFKKPIPKITVDGKDANEGKGPRVHMLYTKYSASPRVRNPISPNVTNRTIRVVGKISPFQKKDSA